MTALPNTQQGATRAAQPKRRGRPGYDLESLLQIAAKLFYERGYDGTSMEELGRKLGITKSAIYYHVRGKEELLKLCVDRALDGLFAVAGEAERAEGRAIDRLEHLVRGSVGVLTEQLPFVTVLLRVRGNSKVERAALARRREFDHIVADLVQQAEAEGDIRPDVDPAITARLLFGLVNSLIDWYRPRVASDSAALADAVAKIAFDGIRV
ncbi:MAG: TetR family transcriptional regulator [Actinophytocola sp.]|nr:TetR family transcriptional regulator [Actinophytocola sp.]